MSVVYLGGMGTPQTAWHRLTLESDGMMTCAQCGPRAEVEVTRHQDGSVRFRCRTARKARTKRQTRLRRPYRAHIGNTCERCGFTHPDTRMLDAHHRNGNHGDDRPENIGTLCPTCHRLEHLGPAAPDGADDTATA